MRIRSLFVYKVDNMAFNINAQVILSGPKNIQKVRSSISKQLSGVTVDVNIKVPKNAAADLGKLNSSLNTLNATLSSLNKNATTATTALNSLSKAGKNLGNFSKNLSSQNQKATKSLDSVGSSAAKAGSQLEEFGKDAALAVRRFSAFTIATGAVFGLVRSITNATSEAVKFERELARVVQVTGATDKQLKGLTRTIDGLSTSLGLDANKLLEVSVTFAQTGQSIDQVAKSIKAVSRASLAATFGDIQKTTEGVIASLAQFKLGADRAEAVLGSLNAVSKSFAVEADDLISVIRRAGGVFAASSVQLGAPEERLRELIGIFTAVRSTTRESADTIATGLRTIFTRIQRPQTIKFLEQFGVQLRATAADAKKFGLAEGDFVGIFESLKRISSEIGGLDTLQLAKVVEELGGVRQVGKLLPALREFEKAERARGVALAGTGSISKDVAIATKTLAVQIENLQQRFGKLIRDVSQSQTFQTIAKTAVSAANAILTLTDALRPALPLLTAFAGIKLAGAAFSFSKGFVGGLKKGGGAGGVGSAVGNLATAGAGGSAGKQNVAAKQASDKQVIAALGKNTIATDKNTQALTAMSTSLTTLNTTQSTLVTSANALATQSTQLIAALNKLPAILLRGNGGGSTSLPIRRGQRRRANGGVIPKFAKGGFVNGPSHAQGGVIAELEGGEFVVPKKDAKRQGFAGGTGKGGVPLPSQRKTRASDEGLEDNSKNKRVFKPRNPKVKGAFISDTVQSLNSQTNNPNTAGIFILQKESKNSTTKLTGKGEFVGSANGLVAGPRKPDFVDRMFDENKDFYTNAYASSLPKKAQAAFLGAPDSESKDNEVKKALKLTRVAGQFPLLTLQSKEAIGEDPDIKTLFSEASREALKVGVENIYASNLIEKISPNVGPLKLQDGQNFKIDNLFEGATDTIEGYLLEGLVAGLTDIPLGGGQEDLDFPSINAQAQKRMQNLFGDAALGVALGDGKRTAAGNESALQAKLKGDFTKNKSSLAKFSPFGQLAATGGRIGLQKGGMVPVAISNGEGLVDAATASKIMPLLERARAGDGSAIQALASQRNIIEDIVGAGTGTSDSIKTNLAAGSFVLQKSIMDRIDDQRQNAVGGGVIGGVKNTTKRFRGRGAEAVTGAAGLGSAVFSALSGDITSLVFSLGFFSQQIAELGSIFKEAAKPLKSFEKSAIRTTKASREAARASGAAGKARVFGRNVTRPGPFIPGKEIIKRSPNVIDKSLLTREKRLLNVQKAGKGDLLKTNQKNIKISNIAKRAKFSIVGVVASLLVDPLLDGVEKSLIGAKKRIGDFEGFTETQGGATTASVVGASRGAISGALTGASLGSFAGPIGTAIGAAAGAAIGGILGESQASDQQAKFSSIEKLNNSAGALGGAIDKVGEAGINNAEALTASTRAIEAFTKNLLNGVQVFNQIDQGISNLQIGNIPTAIDFANESARDTTGGGFAGRGERLPKDPREVIGKVSENFTTFLDSVATDVVDKSSKLNALVQTQLVERIPSDKLGDIAKLGADSSFEDLVSSLRKASDGSDEFNAALDSLIATQQVAVVGAAKKQQKTLGELAGDSKIKGQFFGVGNIAAQSFASAFQDGQSIEKATDAANKQFAAGISKFASSQEIENIFGGESGLIKEIEKAGSRSDGFTGKLEQLSRSLSKGLSGFDLQNAILQFKQFKDVASGDGGFSGAIAQQKILDENIRNTAKGVDLLVTALSRLGSGVDNAVANFENSASNVKNNVSQILSTQQNISPVAKGNVFNDPQATQKQIEAGITRVQSATGGGVGDAEGLATAISLSDQLPSAFKNVIDELKITGEEGLTGENFADKITSEIKGFDKIPSFIRDGLKNQLRDKFTGINRQGGNKGGIDAVQEFAEGGELQKLSEISNKTRETFAKLNETVTKFDALILDSANLQVQATRQLADAQLKAADKTNAFADRFDKFRGGVGKDPLAQATQRLDQKVSILLNKGNVQTNDGGDLLKRRSELETTIQSIRDRIGQTTGLDASNTASLAELNDPQTKALISELGNTTSALEGTKQAIDLLANDTTELAAVEGKLASINESRLTGRQRLTSLFSQLANAKNPFDRKKILNEFQRPLVAAAKAQQGIPLSFKEFAALQSDLLQGVNGLLGTVEKNLFGSSDKEILGRIENLLANNQNTGISALKGLGFGGAGAVLGGAAATAQGQNPEEQKLLGTADALLKRSVDLVNGVAQANADAIASQQTILQGELSSTKAVLVELNKEFEKLRNTILTINTPDAAPFPAANPPAGFAKGGVVYRATGGMASSPFDAYKKGTDDVPAMLTEGEFVMSKPAVQRIGVGNLNMLNNLSGPKRERVLYAEDGGSTDGSKSIIPSKLGDSITFNTDEITPELKKLSKVLIKVADQFGTSSGEYKKAESAFNEAFNNAPKSDSFKPTVKGLQGIQSFLTGDKSKNASLFRAKKVSNRADAQEAAERQAQTNESARRNRAKTGPGVGLFGSGAEGTIFTSGRTKQQFENQNRGISEKDFAKNLDIAKGRSASGRAREAERAKGDRSLPDSFFPTRESNILAGQNGSGLGAKVAGKIDKAALERQGRKFITPKVDEFGNPARDPQRLTDEERKNRGAARKKEADDKKRKFFEEKQAKEQANKDARDKSASIYGEGVTRTDNQIAALGDDPSNKAEKRFRKAKRAVYEEQQRLIKTGGDPTEYTRFDKQESSFFDPLFGRNANPNPGGTRTKLGELRDEEDLAKREYEKERRERKKAKDDAAAKPEQADAKAQQAANDAKARQQAAKDAAPKIIRETDVVPFKEEDADLRIGQATADSFGVTTQEKREKQREKAFAAKGLPQTISSTELTPEEQKIITRYLQDQEKETGKTAGTVNPFGRNDLGDLGVSADGSKDAAVDKFVRDRNLETGGADGTGLRKGSQPDPERLAKRDAAVLGTTSGGSAASNAAAKQEASNIAEGPLTQRDTARQRYEGRLNDPKASEGTKQAARRGLRDLDRKENPLPTGDSESDVQARRDAQISRADKRLADGNLSEGGAQAARRAKRDAERKNRDANPLTSLSSKNTSGQDPADLTKRRRDAARQRYEDRLNDPNASAGKKGAARRGLRDLDRKEREENPETALNPKNGEPLTEKIKKRRRDAQISRSDKRIADGNLSEGGAQAARRAKRDAERGNREANPETRLNPTDGEDLSPAMIKRRREAQTQRSTLRLNDPTSSEGTKQASRNALGLTSKEIQEGSTISSGAASQSESIKKPENFTLGQRFSTPTQQKQQTAGPMQIQGATELNQSLTQMATVSKQLLSAADKLTNLPALEITINGKIAPIEVILNGTQMLAEFKQSFSKELMPLIAAEIEKQKLAL